MTAKDRLREVKIINGWDASKAAQARGLLGVFIAYTPSTAGERGGRSAHWTVTIPGRRTDPGSHWTNYGNKVFTVGRVQWRQRELEAAQAWVKETYGVDEPWVKITGLSGYWFPKSTAEVVAGLLKQGPQ